MTQHISSPGMARPLASVVGRRMARSRMVQAVVAETGKAALPQRTINVMTYNILAQKYVQNGWHSYCKSRYLQWDYRRELLFEELEGYDSDIICLQEVEADVFSLELQPFLGMRGYRGHYLARQYGENVQGPPEGVALFYRTDMFELIRHRAFTFSSAATDPPPPPAPSLSSSDGEDAPPPLAAGPTDAAAVDLVDLQEALRAAAAPAPPAATAAEAEPGAGDGAALVAGGVAVGKGGQGPASSEGRSEVAPLRPSDSRAGREAGGKGEVAAVEQQQEEEAEELEEKGGMGWSDRLAAAAAAQPALARGGGGGDAAAAAAAACSPSADPQWGSTAAMTSAAVAITAAGARAAVAEVEPAPGQHHCNGSSSSSSSDASSSSRGGSSSGPSSDANLKNRGRGSTAVAAAAGASTSLLEEPTTATSRATASPHPASAPPPPPPPPPSSSLAAPAADPDTAAGTSGRASSSGRGASGSGVSHHRGNNEFWAVFTRRQEGAILALLRHKPSNRPLLAAVTHLFWNPAFPDVKAFQAAVLCREIAAFLRQHAGDEAAASEVPVVLAGDFNSLSRKRLPDAFDPKLPRGPEGLVSGVYTLLTRGSLPPDHPDHPATRRRPGETSNADFRGLTLTTSGLSLASAYRLANGRDPPLTTRTATFAGCLDYIFVSPAHFDVTSTLELPYDMSPASCDAVRDPLTDVRFRPIPSADYPSDHLSLVALLRLKEGGEEGRARDGRDGGE